MLSTLLPKFAFFIRCTPQGRVLPCVRMCNNSGCNYCSTKVHTIVCVESFLGRSREFCTPRDWLHVIGKGGHQNKRGPMPVINKLLIANRGEIAVRIIRTCQKLGITTVVAYTVPDAETMAVKQADFSVCIGDYTQYLSIDSLIEVAKNTQCDAVHPGKLNLSLG